MTASEVFPVGKFRDGLDAVREARKINPREEAYAAGTFYKEVKEHYGRQIAYLEGQVADRDKAILDLRGGDCILAELSRVRSAILKVGADVLEILSHARMSKEMREALERVMSTK